jgi:addiction module RelB/DinJ family antitoxin
VAGCQKRAGHAACAASNESYNCGVSHMRYISRLHDFWRMHMGKTGYITARIEPKLKARAARVLANVGVSTTDAITMFLRQVVLRNGLPFEVRVPNAETKRAIKELENPAKRSKLKRYATTEALFSDVARRKGNRAKRRV